MLKEAIDGVLGQAGLKLVKSLELQGLRDRLEAAQKALAEHQQQRALERQFLEPYAFPLKPTDFKPMLRSYDALSVDERAIVVRQFMTRVAAEPQFFDVLLSAVGGTGLDDHYLYKTIAGGYHFANGELEHAKGVFDALAKSEPSAFHLLCLARTLLALDDDAAAIALLQQAHGAHLGDTFIAMELATTLYRTGNINGANRIAEKVLPAFAAEHAAIAPLQAEIDKAIAEGALEKAVENDIYTDDLVADTWWFYYRSYMTGREFRDGNVELDSGIRRVVAHLLETDLHDASTFIDFGAFCGYTIAKLAEAFPGVKFIGIDRPEYAKWLNNKAFPGGNLRFVAGDILDLLDSEDFGSRPILFHSRTAVFCYPAFLSRLYSKARARGFRDIVFQEGSTFFSRWHLKFFDLGKYPAASMAGRGSTFLHDYKALLEREGYVISSSSGIRPRLLLDDQSGFGADHRVIHAKCAK